MKNIEALQLKADTLFDMSNDESLSKEERKYYYDQAFKTYELIRDLEEPKKEDKLSLKDKVAFGIQALSICATIACQIIAQNHQTKIWRESVMFEKTGTVTTTGGKSVLKNVFMPFKR